MNGKELKDVLASLVVVYFLSFFSYFFSYSIENNTTTFGVSLLIHGFLLIVFFLSFWYTSKRIHSDKKNIIITKDFFFINLLIINIITHSFYLYFIEKNFLNNILVAIWSFFFFLLIIVLIIILSKKEKNIKIFKNEQKIHIKFELYSNYISLGILLFFVIVFFLNSKNIGTLFFDFSEIMIWNLFLTLIIALFCSFFVYLLIMTIIKIINLRLRLAGKRKQTKKEFSIYFAIFLVFCILTIVLGIDYTMKSLSPAPIYFQSHSNDNLVKGEFQFINCHNQDETHKHFVVNDTLTCKFGIYYNNSDVNNTYRVNNVLIFDYLNNQKINYTIKKRYQEENNFYFSQDDFKYTKIQYEIDITIPNQERIFFNIHFLVSNSSLEEKNELWKVQHIKIYKIIPEEKYPDWENKVLFWIIGIISFAFLGISTIVINIRKLIEKES